MVKSSHHQSENDFRFQTFAERIAAVNIDVIHKIKHHDDDVEEQSTYFGEALLSWSDMNCTEHFNNFQQEISEKVHTFPQLVHNEESIVEALKKHLLIPNTMAYEPLLDLVVQLARDLQADFYKHFHDMFHILVRLLNSITKDVDVLEKLFTCLAYLFKFLWRYLAKDIKEVYGMFSALLASHYKEYIRKFAAESFAFLMRKVKDHSGFFDFLFSTLEEDPDKAEGVGQLLFEMIKGVKKQFHSTTEKIFPVILSKLGPMEKSDSATKLPWKLVEKSLVQMMKSCAEHTNRDHIAPLWSILLDCLANLQKECVKVKGQKQKVKAEQLCRLLRVTSVWLDHHQGALACDISRVAEVLTVILKTSVQPECVGQPLLNAVSSILVNLSDRLTMGDTAKMLAQVYVRKFPLKDLTVFTKSLYDLFMFDKDVLPNLLNYIQTHIGSEGSEVKDILLALVTDLVLHKVKAPADGSQLSGFKPITLEFGTVGKSRKKLCFQEYLLSMMDTSLDKMADTGSLAKLWAALVCLPHCSPMDRDTAVEKMKTVWSLLLQREAAEDDSACRNSLLFVMEQVIMTMILMNEDSQIYSWLAWEELKTLLRKHPTHGNVLKMVNLYLSQCALDLRDDIVSQECLLELLPLLQVNLASWSSQVRLLSVHTLSLFPVDLPPVEEQDTEQLGVFDICQAAERVDINVYNYRERLRHLRKLDYKLVQPNIPIGPFEKVPLYYLLGSLYVNFKLMWEPVRELVKGYAVGMEQDVFWSVMGDQLQLAAERAANDSSSVSSQSVTRDVSLMVDVTAVSEIYTSCHRHQSNRTGVADHINLRLQLWRAMELFPDKCEARGKLIVPIFLKFLSEEYHRRDMNSAPTEDISIKHGQADQSEFEDEDEEDETKEEPSDQRSKYSKKKKRRKGIIPSLLAHLHVFSKLRNPKSLPKEQELRNIYQELLHHKDLSVQKAAFSCVVTYNHKYLNPYKENFSRLLDDKTFKEEIIAFSIDPGNTQIKADHRQNLLPVLMGVLYGRMQSRIGKETAGKAKSNVRRAVVFRFLAGCSTAELKVFLDLVFQPLLNFVQDDPVAMVMKVSETIDIENVFPLRRMRGCAWDRGPRRRLAGLTWSRLSVLPFLWFLAPGSPPVGRRRLPLGNPRRRGTAILPSLVSDGSIPSVWCPSARLDLPDLAAGAYQLGEDSLFVVPIVDLMCVHFAALGRLGFLPSSPLLGKAPDSTFASAPRAARCTGLHEEVHRNAMQQFHEEFEKYAFSAREVEAVFDTVVSPQLDRLAIEGVYSATPLLKLFSVWTRHIRYFYLLTMPTKEAPELTPLSAVFSLLNAKGCNSKVSSLILEMVDNLLSLEESEEGEIMLKNLSEVDRENYLACKQDDSECGVGLLRPYIPDVLVFLKKSIQSIGSSLSNRKQGFVTELKMLAKVSCHVTSDDQCTLLCSMLLPFLDQKVKRTMDVEENVLNSIVNLTKVLQSPREFYRPVSKLFSVLCNRQSRNQLCTILKTIGEKCPEYRDISLVVEKLNAWNPRRADEPNYDVRLEAFNKFNDTVRGMTIINVDALIPIMHNCCHFILKVEDMSLRDNSTFCLVTIVTQLTKTDFNQDVFREVVTQGVLPMVKSGLYDKSETVRHEFLTLLGVLVRAFPDHPTFEGLIGLSDKEIDYDFYENIKHIQVHRRVKAMRKLTTYLETTTLRREHLTSYFLPLSSLVILDPAYLKIQGLKEAAIDLIAVLCKLLPWPQYLQQLRFYLSLLPKKVENQKLLVRVVVAVLNSFHFDISKSELFTSTAPKLVETAGVSTDDKDDTEQDTEGNDKPGTDSVAEVAPVAMETGERSPVDQEEFTSDGRQLCSAKLATKIHGYVLKTLIPELHKLLTQKINREEEHKSVRSKFADDHEILRVPIALAMIKLLQTLPRGALKHKLPGILMKVCSFLKSRSREVRETSRDTLVRISQSLGLRYFNFIVKEMREALTRGYQLQVLGFSVNRLLINIQPQLKPGDLDPALHNLSEVFKEELFGTVAEEKDVEGITKKLMEAKETKSYDSYEIVAKYVGVGSVHNLISSLKQLLESTHSQKTSQKVEEVFRRMTSGLMENTGLTTGMWMTLLHGLIVDNMEEVEEEKQREAGTEKEKESQLVRRPENCLLLPSALPRGGEKSKTHRKTNMHIMVAFGAQILHMCLKRSHLLPSNYEHLQLLDPLVEPLCRCLYSKHVKVNSLALRCFSFILKFPLPALKKNISKISQGMFLLLSNYASAGAARGDNQELVIMCFKAVTVLVRDVDFYQVDTEQLQVLLTFCEEDLLDHTRQSTGFNLLRAILSRKLKVKELHDLMERVRELSITGSSGHVKLHCRQVFLQYLLDYPQKNAALAKHMEYYVTQLTYELEEGRVSALEMLATIFSNFPVKVLIQFAGLFFVPMTASLMNDESQKCRKLTALAIKALLEKVDAATRDVLFSIVSSWMKDEKVIHRTLASQVCGLFAEVEKTNFERRLADILPLIQQQLDPDRYVEKEGDREFELDHCLYSLLVSISKLLNNCRLVRNKKYTDGMNTLWEHVQHHLLYPHAWSRFLTASQLFGHQLFSAWPLDDVQSQLESGQSKDYLLTDTRQKLRGLTQSFITQLQSEHLTEDLINQIVKNMLYVGKVIKLLPSSKEDPAGLEEEPEESGGPTKVKQGLSVKWIVKRMVREAHHEAINNTKVTLKREGIFKWLAAVCLEQDRSSLQDILKIVMPALHREMTTQANADSSLKTLAQEVMDLLKKLVGVEVFSQVYATVQQTRAEKRAGKKQKRAVEAVSQPEVAARRKIRKYQVRKESKKRKIQMMKTGKNPKKLKLRKMAILED
ncbi:LOW QUALITY PROTEIN: small subunit processome component 20 homolog [Haliotis rubra]|uniref:LOW QUALITY PROTEIN: small subunit processome component 20 homolog n=1 Tax=Haliotis rubra TaxID=36100 RepID=UPI001EE57397|nr:LOW QUALITY PROTEIN: small subunit processome component 20 homolog [Haliotis rubra]